MLRNLFLIVLALVELACNRHGLRIVPEELLLTPGGSVQLRLESKAPPGPVSWRVLSPGGGSIDSDGRYVAPSSSGTYEVEARCAFGGVHTKITVRPIGNFSEIKLPARHDLGGPTIGLLDGRAVLVGRDGEALVLDPSHPALVETGPMTVLRSDAALVLLPDGRVLAIGGQAREARGGDSRSGIQDKISQIAASRERAAEPASPRQLAFTLQANPSSQDSGSGTAYARSASEPAPSGDPSCVVEALDPVNLQWKPLGRLIFQHSGHTATLLQDGTILVAGGDTNTGGTWDDSNAIAEIFDPATGVSSKLGRMAFGRTYHTATLLPTGKVFFACGDTWNEQHLWGTAEVFDPLYKSFLPYSQRFAQGRQRHSAVLLNESEVLVAGSGTRAKVSPEIFNLTTGLTSTYPGGGTPAGALPMKDGTILLWSESSIEIYDPASLHRKALHFPFPRIEEPLVLANGRILIHDGDRIAITQ